MLGAGCSHRSRFPFLNPFRIFPRINYFLIGLPGSGLNQSVGRRRRVEARGRKPTCKNQKSKFGLGCGQILNFEFCGVGSQSVGRSVAVVGRRRRVAVVVFFLQKSKFKIWPRMRPNFEFWFLRRRVSIVAVVASRRVVSKKLFTCTCFGFDICNPKLLTLKNRSSIVPSLQNLSFIKFFNDFHVNNYQPVLQYVKTTRWI